ncbi:MAG TPA: trehalase family glycosidase [Candidatus Latescibacteria bacterium]|nr:trehalase family glycosidase [Candidatus Latescibacterota bacterium]
MPRRPALYPRQKWEWAKDLPVSDAPWEDLLRLPDIRFLTDNQVSLWTSPDSIGLEKVWFYPVPRAPHLEVERFDSGRIAQSSVHVLRGPRGALMAGGKPVTWDTQNLQWSPAEITRTFVSPEVTLQETVTIVEDAIVVWLRPVDGTSELPLSAAWSSSVERTLSGSWRMHDGARVCMHDDGIAHGWVWFGSEVTNWQGKAASGKFGWEASIPPQGGVLVLLLGYDQAAVERRLEAMIAQCSNRPTADIAELFLTKARDAWQWYMKRMVPGLKGAEEWVRRLYYYQTALHKINLYDIPYEPFVYPYTCPWKTGAVWQWSWNTPMNSIAERWLNDPAWAESGIESLRENGGALNIGASLHRLRKPRQFRDVNEYLPALQDAIGGVKNLPATARQFDWAFIMPHTTPLGVHGIWEVFRRTGDEDYLRRQLPEMVAYEARLTSHDADGDGLVEYEGMVDEYDYSLRWRTAVNGYKKGTESLIRFDRPLELIDINAQLCLLREDIIEAAGIVGDRNLAKRIRQRLNKTARAINDLMWDETRGWYGDLDAVTHELTGVCSVAAFSALMSGVAPADRAERMVRLLQDPAAFGTPYPVPSVAADTPDLDPGHITYGGDVLITSGVWLTVVALVRCGFLDEARRIIWKALRMLGENAPTSSYSYNSMTGAPNMDPHTFCSQSAITLDLFVRFVVGFVPRYDDIIECWPFALPTEWERLEFGPMTWRGDVDVTVVWDSKSGYTVRAGRSEFTAREPRHLWLALDQRDRLVELPDPSVSGMPVMT